MMFDINNKKTYKMTVSNSGKHENDFEITMTSATWEGLSFTELMNMFRLFVVANGYSSDTARNIQSLSNDDLNTLGYEKADFDIMEYETK